MLERELVLPHLIAKRATEQPDTVFLVDVTGPTLTWAQLHEANLVWADALRRLGVQPGDNVITMMPNGFDAYHAWLGISWLRAVECPINTMHKGRMLQYQIATARASTAVMSQRFLDRLAEVAGELPELRTVVVPDADEPGVKLPFRTVTRSEFLSGARADASLQGPAHYDISCMIYTSGTTGPSKGVLVPWAELYWFGLGIPDEALLPGEAYYSFWPPYHVAGKVAMYLPAVRGGRVVLREVFSVSNFWDDVRRFDCKLAGLVGPLAQLLLAQPPKPDDADNPLRSVTCGPLFPQIDEFRKRFGVEMATGYGMTEIGAPLASDGWNIPNWQTCGKVRPGRPGYQVRVVDEHDEEVPPGVVGELVVRADEPWVMNAGYFGMPEKTAEAWRNGWFHTGDGFRYDEQGNFYFVDRIKDAIRRRGENISSFEVEAYVNEHPDVEECAAIGVPSEFGEDEVKVCVVRRPGSDLTPQQLIEYLIPRMPRFMIPRYVEFLEALPKTEATARVRKIDLRQNPLNEHTWDREKAGVVLPK